jgi:hypothetical protein
MSGSSKNPTWNLTNSRGKPDKSLHHHSALIIITILRIRIGPGTPTFRLTRNRRVGDTREACCHRRSRISSKELIEKYSPYDLSLNEMTACVSQPCGQPENARLPSTRSLTSKIALIRRTGAGRHDADVEASADPQLPFRHANLCSGAVRCDLEGPSQRSSPRCGPSHRRCSLRRTSLVWQRSPLAPASIAPRRGCLAYIR